MLRIVRRVTAQRAMDMAQVQSGLIRPRSPSATRCVPINAVCSAFIRSSPKVSTGRQWLASIRSEEHTSELQSLMRISYAVFCLKKKNRSELHQPTFISSVNKSKKQTAQRHNQYINQHDIS